MRRLVATSLAALLLASCGQGDGGNQAAGDASLETNAAVTPGAPSQDLAALVGANPRLTQLIKAAGMEPVLAGKEPYTLLLPSNAALDKLDQAIWEGLEQ